MPILSEWESFYVIVGSSGAALVGLQFVVITLIADRRALASRETLNAFGTPTVVHFVGALVLSAVMSAPWPTLGAVSTTVAVCGLAGLLYALIVTRRASRQEGYTPDREDWWWYVLTPCGIYATLLIAAIFLPGHPHTALFVIAAVVLSLLLIGIRNAWDTVTYVATGEHEKAPVAAQASAEPPTNAAREVVREAGRGEPTQTTGNQGERG
ncbi:MAG TPA: hypothetical protein VGS22_09320 [Thermoanaerobaculia bacterium]|jgi:hypothetical protein|nr:hypothetical protein [Thermoanaerobaculia bacterium]